MSELRQEGHADTLRYLLSVGADMNAKDHDGCTGMSTLETFTYANITAMR